MFGPLPGYNKGPLVERSAGLFFCLTERPVCQGSAAPTPLGATLPDSLGGSLLEFLQLRSCDRRASVSSSFPSQPSLGGAPLLRCQVALSLGTPATDKGFRAFCLASASRWIHKTALGGVWCSFHWKLRLNGTAQVRTFSKRRQHERVRCRPLPGYGWLGALSRGLRIDRV